MIFLPRGNPVRQNVDPARINLPLAMEKLRSGTFTGYLRFDAPKGTGIILFRAGNLISAIYTEKFEADRLIAYDAIAKIFKESILGNTVLNIYRLSEDLTLFVHALLHGRYLHKGQDLNSLDVESQLAHINTEKLTVCLRVYAEDQSVLIFYDHGCAQGFFHEGATDLQSSADVAISVARLPGAKLDMVEIRSANEIVLVDLMSSSDLKLIWQRTRESVLNNTASA